MFQSSTILECLTHLDFFNLLQHISLHENLATMSLILLCIVLTPYTSVSLLQGCSAICMPRGITFVSQSSHTQRKYNSNGFQCVVELMWKIHQTSRVLRKFSHSNVKLSTSKRRTKKNLSSSYGKIYHVFMPNKNQILIHKCWLHCHPWYIILNWTMWNVYYIN